MAMPPTIRAATTIPGENNEDLIKSYAKKPTMKTGTIAAKKTVIK